VISQNLRTPASHHIISTVLHEKFQRTHLKIVCAVLEQTSLALYEYCFICFLCMIPSVVTPSILTGICRGFPQSFQRDAEIVVYLKIKELLLPSVSFPVHYSRSSCHLALQYELLTVLLNKLQINKCIWSLTMFKCQFYILRCTEKFWDKQHRDNAHSWLEFHW
jgi:hypothetical protein